MDVEMKSMHYFHLLLGSLVTYRLALLVAKESGPMFVFRKLRRLPEPKSSLKEGLSCLYCTSVWLAAPVTGYFWWLGVVELREMPLWWLAMSALAIFYNQAFTKG